MFREIVMIDYGRPLEARLASRKYCGPYRWTPAAPGTGRGFYSGSSALDMDSHGSSFRLRLEDANDHIRGRRNQIRGYYCDPDCTDTLQPIIARLPRGRGFLAGWTMGAGMCASLEGDIYPDAGSAASAAHCVARDVAEDEWLRREEELEELEEAA